MSIFTMFGKSQANEAPAAAPTNSPGNLPAQPKPQAEPTPAEPVEPTAPLDKYSSLWEDEPNQNLPNTNNAAYVPNLTQEQLSNVTKGLDFSKSISPEMLEAIQGGGEGAMKAMLQAISSVGQQAVLHSTVVNNKMTEEAVKAAVERTKGGLPELLRQQNANATTSELNPLLSNPAVAPIIEAAQEQFLRKNPNATPKEIAQMNNDFAVAMGSHFAPKPVVTPSAEDKDWDAWLKS